MATTDLNRLPASARNRIEKLETTVTELERTLLQVLMEMKRQGMAFPAKKTPTLRKPGVRRAHAHQQFVTKAASVLTGLAAAEARGEAAKVEWVNSGEVVPAKTLADAWGLTPQALGPAADRGEVFAVVVKRQRFYPKEFLQLNRDDVGAVSKALGSLSPSEKLIFWKRPHGALGGKTVLQSLSGKTNGAHLARVAQLAHAWAVEARPEIDVTAAS